MAFHPATDSDSLIQDRRRWPQQYSQHKMTPGAQAPELFARLFPYLCFFGKDN